ncbi:hypothetical protein [Methylocella tundrae]|uniref:hypothetical protein n=1 Tax=Methylocella tundrae TaxID=227605 RepID=UPI0030FEE03F|nr:hypothetical protein SIN04_07635 [Methylocella tundrae]
MSLFGQFRAACAFLRRRRGAIAPVLTLAIGWALPLAALAQAPDCQKPGAADAALCAKLERDKLPPAPADPAARLARASVSAATDETTLLTVETPGRLSIRAQSGAGVALQLVDMMTGPGEIAGEQGVRDGRLDVLLDRGVYRLRSLGAKGAIGEAKLAVLPFHSAGVAKADLLRGGEDSAELGDLAQRSYWIVVSPGEKVSVEAVGRALGDLRLWRNGTDLVDLKPAIATVEPEAGHPMARLRVEGAAEPGLYLVTAYGGAPSVWADGNLKSPLHIRVGQPQSLVGGWFEGSIGPIGSLRFTIPPPATYVRLELDEPAPAQLSVARGNASPEIAVIAKASRQPVAALTVAAKGDEPATAEVSGLQGQAFRLRALNPSDTLRVDAPGPHLVAVDVTGEGGDELPATVLLARFTKGKGSVVASKALRIARGEAWRAKFNLRGPSSLIFEIANSGPVALSTQGIGVRAVLEPLLGTNAPRADGKIPQQWDVEAGWYTLKLEPVRDAVGVIDLIFGQPGLAPAPSPLPSRTVIDFGLRNFDKGAYYQIFGNSGPNLALGPRARKLPADLGAGPLIIEQQAQIETPPPAVNEEAPAPPPLPPKRPAAGTAPERPASKATGPGAQKPSNQSAGKPAAKAAPLKAAADAVPGAFLVPLRAPPGGAIAAADVNGRPIAIILTNETADKDGRTLTATIPASRLNRRVILTWSKVAPPSELPVVATPASLPRLAPEEPQFFDLARDESRAFRLDVAEGGLYRIETLGRLKTSATIGTTFIPAIDRAKDNGAGHNALLQSYLRAGSYRVTVKASDSEGHLGLIAHRASLNDAGGLAPGQSARAALMQGKGAVFTVDAPRTATYRLDLYSLGKDFPARLEDADGWPLTPPGPLATLEQKIEKGRYRLVVPPVEMDARVVARFSEVVDEAAPQGHGPHALRFDVAQKFQWREPVVADAPREPDRWTFSLKGPSHVTLDVSDGMSAELLGFGERSGSIAKIIFKHGFEGELQPGDYEIDARGIGRNDRLDYELALKSLELQPGAARLIELPASVPFAIGADRIVSVTSFGAIELAGALRDGAGQIIERLNGRVDDWNISLSRQLPAGSYRLDLAAMKTEAASSEARDEPSDDDTADEAPSDGASPDDQVVGAEDSDATGPDDSVQDDADHPEADQRRTKVELHLDLPETLQGSDLDLTGAATVAGSGAHQLALPAVEEGALLVVAAQSLTDAVLSLERRDADGQWRSVGFERGRTPVVAAPSDGDGSRPWRVTVWPANGDASILLAARAVSGTIQGPGQVGLEKIPIEGLEPPVEVAAVSAEAKSLLLLTQAPDGLRAGSAFGHMLAPVKSGVIAPQSERLWLVKRGGESSPVELGAIPSTTKNIALDLASGDVATLSQPIAGAGSLRVWRAQSSYGQPGLSAGKGMGVAPAGPIAGALALNGGEPLRIWNAGPGGPLRLDLEAFDLTAEPMAQTDAQYAATLAPRTAQLVRIAGAPKEIEVNLAPGAAAFLSGGDRATTVWGGARAVSRRLSGGWANILFVNIGAEASSVAFAVTPATDDKPLATGEARKLFSGAAGSMSLRVEAAAGDRLIAAGARAAFISDDGAVLKGGSLILPGPGELILDHDAGLVAAWIENDEKSPWPATEPQKIEPPRTVSLEGQAMTLALAPATPMLLNARSTAPVILALSQKDAKGDPELFPAGAEFHAYVEAGEARLRVYSPHDGALSGSLEVTLSPLIPINEGVGEARALAPGGAALFVFDAPRAQTIGVGVRSDPDSAKVRLLDANGRSLGEGPAQLRQVEPGRYLIEARAPADGPALVVRPALVGLTPPSNGPPPDVAEHYLELVGLRPTRAP